ncbi:acetyl esterase/lipase [Lachnospiraceae bacterium PF1-21]|uniref:Alpha/beta hydrolase n=1 Tax=Ohessyouella blattaphilus TaxID=2949333 RepID=A0ABT1EKZ0_9FIRM|nr:alpha/beta hydrolase [Ohessyouella blattaphilus]MCP1111186.1 alpha/beta hydrolase [Ohessyouella blattaphilus]MCR8564580.1 alpha/beta hydrolase [Ohessyouella blattaphilus]
MAINNTMKRLLKSLSYDGIEVKSSRQLANLKGLDPLKIFRNTLDIKMETADGHQIPVRVFFPEEVVTTEKATGTTDLPVFLFLHGGGWVTESVDTYERICARLAQETKHLVIAVEYRLAPEHPFPAGLMDCYCVAKALYSNEFFLRINPDKITVIGDSAGGNLTAALSLMARDKGEFTVARQILIYPAVYNDYSARSPYLSVQENGSDYLLTAGKIEDYMDLYQSKPEDRKNPYFAPLLETDLTRQPDTLILTAEFDPLRDEGEDYGKRLAEAGNQVEVHRIKDALHGYFALGIKYLHVQESIDIINHFMQEYADE